MIDMRCSLVPAGVPAWGVLVRPGTGNVVPAARPRHAVVRSLTPYDLTGTAIAAPAAPVQGTGLPTAGQLGADATGIQFENTHHPLGIHSPGRPQS